MDATLSAGAVHVTLSIGGEAIPRAEGGDAEWLSGRLVLRAPNAHLEQPFMVLGRMVAHWAQAITVAFATEPSAVQLENTEQDFQLRLEPEPDGVRLHIDVPLHNGWSGALSASAACRSDAVESFGSQLDDIVAALGNGFGTLPTTSTKS